MCIRDSAFGAQHVVQRIKRAAACAVVAVHAAVQLQHIFAARRLVQAVNVLRDDGFQLTGLLQPRKGKVRDVYKRQV